MGGAGWLVFPRPPPAKTVTSALDSQVLVLNRLWQPVNVCSARRALGLLFVGHAQVVWVSAGSQFATHDFESWQGRAIAGDFPGRDYPMVHTVSRRFPVPKIIVLGVFDRLPRKEVKFSRDNVFQRDGYVCQYCRKRFESRDLNLDHVIPRDKGGGTNWDNVVCSCIRCNTKKANKLPKEAGMYPARQPRAPRWRPLLGLWRQAGGEYHESWRFFLEPNAASVELSG